MANLRDKNDRAVLAFIKASAQAVDAGVRLFPCNYSGNRTHFDDGSTVAHGIVDVITAQGPEDPVLSGNHWLDVKVRISYPAAAQSDQTTPQQNRVALGKLVDAIYDWLHQSDDGQSYKYTAHAITTAGNLLATDLSAGTDPAGVQSAKDNADMGDYTCMDMRGVSYLGAPEEGATALTFVEIMKFQVYAAPKGGLN